MAGPQRREEARETRPEVFSGSEVRSPSFAVGQPTLQSHKTVEAVDALVPLWSTSSCPKEEKSGTRAVQRGSGRGVELDSDSQLDFLSFTPISASSP